MRKTFRSVLGAAALAVASFATAGCDDFLTVENPGVIEASTIDPVADAETFSLSAQTDFFNAYDDAVVYGAFFSGEAWVDDSFPTRNDIAKRVADERNTTLSGELFNPLAFAIASNARVLRLLAGTPGDNTISTARSAMNLGFSLVVMGETFCQGVISQGPERLGSPITSAQTLDSAVVYFQKAVAQASDSALAGSKATAAVRAEASTIRTASRIGIARALLQKGDNAGAAAAAQAAISGHLPATAVDAFRYQALKVDDPSNRGRLGNTAYSFTILRPNLVVPPYYRALNDPRVTFVPPPVSNGVPTTGQGGALPFFSQSKYPGWGSPVTVASTLEARYILAEAQFKLGNPAPATALIATRRAAGSAVPGDDFATGNPILIELLDQRSRDLYLEGHHMADFRRNPNETPYVPRAGTAFYNPQFGGTFGPQTCLPITIGETSNNPNFPRT